MWVNYHWTYILPMCVEEKFIFGKNLIGYDRARNLTILADQTFSTNFTVHILLPYITAEPLIPKDPNFLSSLSRIIRLALLLQTVVKKVCNKCWLILDYTK